MYAALYFSLLGTFAFLAFKIIAFLAADAPPFGYYYDLGINALATDYVAGAIHSWRDLIDNIGWGSWIDFPNFLFNPTTSYFVLVPIQMLLHNVWLSIKSVQILEVIVAFGGAATLYSLIARRDVWSLVAGLLYAILPATALQIRGNLDIGWVFALLPVALACVLYFVRRFGVFALPLCGIVGSLAGLCFAAEYVVLSSLPIYAVAVAAAFRRPRLRAVAVGLVGFVCLFALGAYFILPTFGSERLFTDPASRTVSLAAGSELGVYSESWFALLVLMPQEFLISSFSQFNALPDLGFVWVVTFALWILAGFTALRALRRPGSLRFRVVCIVFVLLVLAMGTVLPSGGVLWAALRGVPAFAFVRTPDRFLIVPFLFLIIGATESLAALARSERVQVRAFAVALVALAIALFLKVDFDQHWLTTESDVAFREPDLEAVRDAVTANGGRMISYAYIRDGSQFFNPYYGVPTQTLSFLWDVSARYDADGLGGYGLFSRSDVRSVIASPNWMLDSSLLPSTDKIDGKFPGRRVFSSIDGLLVKKIASRPILSVARTSCVAGGPGLLDWATALPGLADRTFVRGPAGCSGRTYLDYDPRSDLVSGSRILGFWTADQLLPSATPLHDADYPYFVGRTYVNDRWYRDSIDGDDVLAGAAARNVVEATTLPVRVPASSVPTRVTLLVRLASRSFTTLTVKPEVGAAKTISIVPRRGLRWYEVTLSETAHAQTVMLAFDSPQSEGAVPPRGWQGVVLDRVVAVAGDVANATTRTPLPADGVLFSIPRMYGGQSVPAGDHLTNALQPVDRSNVVAETVSGQMREVAERGEGTLDYRWVGPAGTYLIVANSSMAGERSQIAIRSGARSVAAGSSTDAMSPVRVLLSARLVRGSRVTIKLTSAESVPGATASLVSIRVVAKPGFLFANSSDMGGQKFDVNLGDAPLAMASTSAATAVDFSGDGVRGLRDSSIVFRFAGDGVGTAATLRIGASGDGRAIARFACGNRAETRTIDAGDTSISLSGERLSSCRTQIRWVSGALTLTNLQMHLFGQRTLQIVDRVWLPHGSFSVKTYRPALAEGRGTVSIDGAAFSDRVTIQRSGMHRMVLRGVRSDARLLAFLPAMPPSLAAPVTVAASTYRWSVDLKRRETLEVAWFPDGNWRLRSSAGSDIPAPVRCDLVNTCFLNVGPGHYSLFHEWPRSLRLGIIVSAATLLVAVVVLGAGLATSSTGRESRT